MQSIAMLGRYKIRCNLSSIRKFIKHPQRISPTQRLGLFGGYVQHLRLVAQQTSWLVQLQTMQLATCAKISPFGNSAFTPDSIMPLRVVKLSCADVMILCLLSL
jgi:hypothetical protein